MGVVCSEPRFTDNEDGTVTDNCIGLVWLKDANCSYLFYKTWPEALTACNNLANGICGLEDGSGVGDWRLPNVRELLSLVDYSEYDPALPFPNPFIGVQSNHYWSSTTFAPVTDNALRIHFQYGYVDDRHKDQGHLFVWCVRDGN